jgi:hypothetical protein
MDQHSESPIPSQEANFTNKTNIEVRSPQPLNEKVNRILGFLKNRSEVNKNPDKVLEEIAQGDEGTPQKQGAQISAAAREPDQFAHNEAKPGSEQAALLEQANTIWTGLRKVGEILSKIKDNEVVGGLTIAGLGLLTSFIGLSQEISMLMEVAAAGGLSGGSKMEKVKNIGLAMASVAGQDVAGDFYELGQKVVEQAAKSEIVSETMSNARNRMTARIKQTLSRP